MRPSLHRAGLFALTALPLTHCGAVNDDPGSLSVLLEPEDTITQGLEPGTEVENVQDGWRVQFDKYITTVGGIELHFPADEGLTAHNDDLFVVDLKRLGAGGLPLWELPDLRAGRWDFHYLTSGAAHDARRHSNVSRADFDEMVEADATYLLEGSLEQAGGESCPPPDLAVPGSHTSTGENAAGHACYANPSVYFRLLVNAETAFGPCAIDDVPGVSVPSGGTGTVAITLHGDHLFFNGFPSGNEGGTVRLAQWLADSDLDLDGELTALELQSIPRDALAQLDERYHWTGAPIEVLNMWDYVIAQLKTQGHMDGEGECIVDGAGQAHSH